MSSKPHRTLGSRNLSRMLALGMVAAAPGIASAQTAPLAWEASYTADLSAVAAGSQTGTMFTGIGRLNADLDLAALAGWQGAQIHAQAIASMGQRPNDLAGTLQGVNNIEVPENRAKLFEFYLEQQLAGERASLRIGFVDLNSEFYTTDASSLLIAPAFGIGSELSATGPNGPSLFPSTALAARLRLAPTSNSYVQAGVFNAEAGVLGDPGGVRPLFGKGALLIGEAGYAAGEGGHKFAFGAWTYTTRQPDLRALDANGDPVPQRAYGGYVLGQLALDKRVSLFARAGASDGRASPYLGGWQAGLMAQGFVPGRPAGQLSLGIFQGVLSNRFRANLADAGTPARRTETGVELTWSDQLAPWLRLQPDVQWVRSAMRGPQVRNALVLALRATISWSPDGSE